jgi:hypothetical protein
MSLCIFTEHAELGGFPLLYENSISHSLFRVPILSRKSATIFGQGTIPEPSTPHIGREVALVAWTAAFVYIPHPRPKMLNRVLASNFYSSVAISTRQCGLHHATVKLQLSMMIRKLKKMKLRKTRGQKQ